MKNYWIAFLDLFTVVSWQTSKDCIENHKCMEDHFNYPNRGKCEDGCALGKKRRVFK